MVEISGVCLPRHRNLSLIRKYILITWKYPRKFLMYHHYFNNLTVIDGFLFFYLMLGLSKLSVMLNFLISKDTVV